MQRTVTFNAHQCQWEQNLAHRFHWQFAWVSTMGFVSIYLLGLKMQAFLITGVVWVTSIMLIWGATKWLGRTSACLLFCLFGGQTARRSFNFVASLILWTKPCPKTCTHNSHWINTSPVYLSLPQPNLLLFTVSSDSSVIVTWFIISSLFSSLD